MDEPIPTTVHTSPPPSALYMPLPSVPLAGPCRLAKVAFVLGLVPIVLCLLMWCALFSPLFWCALACLPVCALAGIITGSIAIVKTYRARLPGLWLCLTGTILSLCWAGAVIYLAYVAACLANFG